MNKEEIEKLTETSDRSKSNLKRLDRLEDKVENIYQLTLSVKEIATEMKAMREDMTKIDDRVLHLETKPVKRWEGIVDKIMYTILGIIIAYLFKQIGM